MAAAKTLTKPKPVAQQRKELDPASTDYNVRFALHLRRILDENHWTTAEFAQRVNDTAREMGVDFSIDTRAVDTWYRGDGMPKAKHLEVVGRAAGYKDPRFILPPPLPAAD